MGGKRSGWESQTQKGGKEGCSCGGEDAAGVMGVQGRELQHRLVCVLLAWIYE